jgi:hypothetical protein
MIKWGRRGVEERKKGCTAQNKEVIIRSTVRELFDKMTVSVCALGSTSSIL